MQNILKLKVITLFLVLLVVLAACGGSDSSDSKSGKQNGVEELVVPLGEPGVVKDTLGEYEVTVESAEVHETSELTAE